jgi:hypothetical protein
VPLFLERGSNIAPFFIEQLYNIIIIEGQDAKLDACAQGSPDPTVAWEKESQPLTPNKEYKYVCRNDTRRCRVRSDSAEYQSLFSCVYVNISESNSKDRRQHYTFVERK